jgi:predicted nucleic acid-binding Zn ribbon protein
MRGKLNKLSDTLVKILQARGMEDSIREYRIFGQWDRAVGAVIARHTQPSSLRGKKMSLIVDSPAWMQQLTLLKPEIIGKMNRRLGHDAIKDIILKLGVVAPRGQAPEELPVSADLTSDEREKIEFALQGIPDAEIKEAVRRVMERDFFAKKWRKK